MMIGTVVGAVVAPVQHRSCDGQKLLLVRIERPDDLAPAGETVLAIDRAGAGVGERVLVLKEGSSVRALLDDEHAPLRTAIVAVVDEIEIGGRRTFFQGSDA